ncbi:hypothetical protein Mal15_00730 [Stieleria maiorica]|uniref:Uncharacterized protein n=1 Tax=Stieleria maiorica TaxID=2795974 RepID=A0A5B9M9Z6_9BACT|nr:hypothetical protein [Stieleria maiorica]QEF96047.1 hypothetical protein Mal15_00730 [Stieleria maiorica]
MDGITEPVVLVLGHPIAGNPAQFALERAFESMQLRWRVISSDVPPERVEQAIAGAEVLGFRGLLLDQNLVTPVDAPDQRASLYWRGGPSESQWQTENVMATWLQAEIRKHFESLESEIGPLLWIGTPDPSFPTQIAAEESHSPIAWASTEAIKHARLIAVSETVDASQWPPCEDDTLVVDFANPENDLHQIRALGYNVLGREEARVGILLESIQRWTGKQPMVDVLTEAIEEYLAV